LCSSPSRASSSALESFVSPARLPSGRCFLAHRLLIDARDKLHAPCSSRLVGWSTPRGCLVQAHQIRIACGPKHAIICVEEPRAHGKLRASRRALLRVRISSPMLDEVCSRFKYLSFIGRSGFHAGHHRKAAQIVDRDLSRQFPLLYALPGYVRRLRRRSPWFEVEGELAEPKRPVTGHRGRLEHVLKGHGQQRGSHSPHVRQLDVAVEGISLVPLTDS